MALSNTIQVRDNLQGKLEELIRTFDRLTGGRGSSPTYRKRLAWLQQEIERTERAIERLEWLIEDQLRGDQP